MANGTAFGYPTVALKLFIKKVSRHKISIYQVISNFLNSIGTLNLYLLVF
jgi:hypothetical protein